MPKSILARIRMGMTYKHHDARLAMVRGLMTFISNAIFTLTGKRIFDISTKLQFHPWPKSSLNKLNRYKKIITIG